MAHHFVTKEEFEKFEAELIIDLGKNFPKNEDLAKVKKELSGQIASLELKMIGRFDGVQEDIHTLKQDVGSLKQGQAKLEAGLANVQTNIQMILKRLPAA